MLFSLSKRKNPSDIVGAAWRKYTCTWTDSTRRVPYIMLRNACLFGWLRFKSLVKIIPKYQVKAVPQSRLLNCTQNSILIPIILTRVFQSDSCLKILHADVEAFVGPKTLAHVPDGMLFQLRLTRTAEVELPIRRVHPDVNVSDKSWSVACTQNGMLLQMNPYQKNLIQILMNL